MRTECLDRVLIPGERHLGSDVRDYVDHFNATRPHRALGLRPPLRSATAARPAGEVLRHDRRGGLIHEYERHAA